MSILLYAEHSKGKFKKVVFEAASLAKELAGGGDLNAVVIGQVEAGETDKLGTYGVAKVYQITSMDLFSDQGYTEAVDAVATACGANVLVMAQTYDSKSIAPRLAVRGDAALFSGVTAAVTAQGAGYSTQKLANSGKGIETISTDSSKLVVTLKGNNYPAKENPGSATVEAFDFTPTHKGATTTEVVKASANISITEADTVVSGGRGFKGPENWGPLLELAELLEAGTACSKPVSDMDWRPHHEHVGQTGIQIGPNLYIAIGISGAIQHLAGVNSSKNIVVINKDPEAPFFKIADYGIVGDLFEVVPKLIDAVKQVKA